MEQTTRHLPVFGSKLDRSTRPVFSSAMCRRRKLWWPPPSCFRLFSAHSFAPVWSSVSLLAAETRALRWMALLDLLERENRLGLRSLTSDFSLEVVDEDCDVVLDFSDSDVGWGALGNCMQMPVLDSLDWPASFGTESNLKPFSPASSDRFSKTKTKV